MKLRHAHSHILKLHLIADIKYFLQTCNLNNAPKAFKFAHIHVYLVARLNLHMKVWKGLWWFSRHRDIVLKCYYLNSCYYSWASSPVPLMSNQT